MAKKWLKTTKTKVCIVEVAQYSILLKGKHVGISASRPPEAGNFKVMIF